MELDAAYAKLGRIYIPVNYRRTIELLDKGPQKIARQKFKNGLPASPFAVAIANISGRAI
jgi:hypothetical protein